MNLFEKKLAQEGIPQGELHACGIDTIQVNLGLTCNLECTHCHVASSPRRKEQMKWETMEMILHAARSVGRPAIDLTGGAPEMNPFFRDFVSALSREGFPIIVRTNLTILEETDYQDLPEFFREHSVHLVASLPCYLEVNVDRQRGPGVYQASVRALRRLNEVGYGQEDGLPLDLVYNPGGPGLPPDQTELEKDYRRELKNRFGIVFTRLLTLTNMPIGQFLGQLRRTHQFGDYLENLQQAFNPRTLDNLMCRRQISVNWDGILFDCDFNLALRMSVDHGLPVHISEFDVIRFSNRRIHTANHCFGCTAGCGSSCNGALVD